jgi:type VI secretion system protein ImpL
MARPTRSTWRALLALLGLVAAAALIWYVGPLGVVAGVAPLAGEPARWAAIGLLLVLALGRRLALAFAAARRNRNLLAGLLAGSTPAKPGAPGAAEVALLSQRFEQALATLRRTRLGGPRRGWFGLLAGRTYVDQLPWYILIGAPGAGKTTALINSGLEFPLAKAVGAPVLQGVGGTRNCDWWFSSEAVLIDTAGRYTTHDSDRTADRTAWLGFLALLQRHRPRRPINGVLLTLSVGDLLGGSPARRRAHAIELRDRIEELHAQLGISFPIYVLVTKLDLLAGFMDFFADFDRDERAQVWGVTFPYQTQAEAGADGPTARMASEFAALEKRLDDCLLDQLRRENDRLRRAAIYAFPQQWSLLRQALFGFLQSVVAELRSELRPCVRGVYFTSATQEGTPMDRALGGLVRTLGLPGRVLPPARPSGKTFFVTRLLRDVVFAESGLAGTNQRWRQRRALLEGGLLATAGVAIAAAGLLSWQAWAATRERVDALAQRLPVLEREVATARSAAPTDLPALLPALDALAQLDGDAAAPDGASVLQHGLRSAGLDRADMLAAAAHDTYGRTLREAFLPRIAARLEARLRAGERDHVELIYDTLKAYLMLFGGREFDRDALRAYLRTDWEATLPPGTGTAQHEALRRHLDRLLDGGEVGAPSAADPQLIAQARALVASVAPAQRALQRLKQLDVGAAPFSIESAGGSAAARVFVRASGKPLREGIPALYTRSAIEQALPTRTQEVLGQFARERPWVLGGEAAPADAAALPALATEVQQLVGAESSLRWHALLTDLRLAPAPTLAASAEQAALLARADSPLAALLRAAARELPPAPSADDALRRYVAGPPGLDALQSQLGTLAAHLTAVDDAARRQAMPPSSEVLKELAATAQHAPEPLRGLLSQLVATAGPQVFAALREPLSRQVASEVAPQCAQLVAGQYPLVRSATNEVSREAFARAFGAGGVIDGFFQRTLSPHVDTASRPWAWRTGGAGAEGLQAFQRAQAIREAFFRDGGRQLGMKLEWRLLELDPGVAEFALDVDGQVLRFRAGSTAVQGLQWPGPSDSGRVQLQLTPVGGAAGPGHVFQGPWALFRLLDRVRSEPGPAPDRWRLVFDVEGRRARFEVKAPAALNPIARQELEQFQCPKRL